MAEFPQNPDVFKPYHVPKPWGEEFVFALTEHYAGKVLTILPGKRLSLQIHEHKEETLLVLKGPVLVQHASPGIAVQDSVTYDVADAFEVEEGGVIHIAPQTVHRFAAPESSAVTLLEVSTPHLDDVLRIEDDFERGTVELAYERTE